MDNPPDVSIRGRVQPGVKSQIKENYGKLIKTKHSINPKLRKKIKSELAVFHKIADQLIGKNETKLYHQLELKHRLACEKEKVKYIGTRENLQSIIDKHKSAFRREVTKKLPQLKELRKNKILLNSSLSSYIQEVTTPANVSGAVNIEVADLSILEDDFPDDPTMINFTPPYLLSESHFDIIYDNFKSLLVRSDADVYAGLLFHDIESKHEDNAWFTHNAAMYDAYTSVGVNYTMPRTGTISVDVFIQNLGNEHQLSLIDNFGFSEGVATLTNSLYMNIINPNNILPFEIEMTNIEITSDGDNVYRNDVNILDTEFSKWINFKSTGSFSEGTNVQIYVGNKDSQYSIMDDMDCRSTTLFSWFVRNIVVRTE